MEILGRGVLLVELRTDRGEPLLAPSGDGGLDRGPKGRIGAAVLAVPSADVPRYVVRIPSGTFVLSQRLDEPASASIDSGRQISAGHQMSDAPVAPSADRRASIGMEALLADEAFLTGVRERLVTALEPHVLDPFSPARDRSSRIGSVIRTHLAEVFPRAVPDPALVRRLRDELAGLGPLAALMVDPDVTDVLVNGPADVWVERSGRLESTSARFRDVQHLSALMEKIAALVGRHLSLESPCVGRSHGRWQPGQSGDRAGRWTLPLNP